MMSTEERILAEESKGMDTPMEVETHEERTREMKTPGFARMRTDWEGPDAATVKGVIEVVNNRLLVTFADAYQIIYEVYEIVREPEVDEHGEVITDRHGFPVWRRTASGAPVEDFTRMTVRQKENILFQITTRVFDWEQRAADVWGEAMFAKAQWEEAFAEGFTHAKDTKRITDEMGTQHARISAREERYLAIFKSLYSRKADALVRSLTLLGQRLKDVLD